jgi:hypothetical protein
LGRAKGGALAGSFSDAHLRRGASCGEGRKRRAGWLELRLHDQRARARLCSSLLGCAFQQLTWLAHLLDDGAFDQWCWFDGIWTKQDQPWLAQKSIYAQLTCRPLKACEDPTCEQQGWQKAVRGAVLPGTVGRLGHDDLGDLPASRSAATSGCQSVLDKRDCCL